MAEEHPQEKPKDVSPPTTGQQPKGGGPKKRCCLRDAAPQVLLRTQMGALIPRWGWGLSQNPTQSVGLQQSHVNHVGT